MMSGNIRKILSIILMIGICFSLLGCVQGNKDTSSNSTSDDTISIEDSEENLSTVEPIDTPLDETEKSNKLSEDDLKDLEEIINYQESELEEINP